MERWPNLFIVGAPRAGTTSLYEYLKNIQGIYMSPIKEPHYFDINDIPENSLHNPIRNQKKYLDLFMKAKDEKFLAEATPSYLADSQAPKLIHEVSPNALIIISIRDPVERAFSHYLTKIRAGHPLKEIHDDLQNEIQHWDDIDKTKTILHYGLYSEHIQKYLKFFPKNQMKILIFEEFVQNRINTVEEILLFLGLNNSESNFEDKAHYAFASARGPISNYFLTNKTVSKVAKRVIPSSIRVSIREKLLVEQKSKPQISNEDREALMKFYNEEVKKLQQMLGRKLPWPNFKNN